MRLDAPEYIGSHFFPNEPLGTLVQGYRNENLENQTFADNAFDIVVTLDVFEHLFDPAAAHREIWRTLKPGGAHICTFPVKKNQTEPMKRRAELLADGSIRHLETPEFHGNPINGDGALVTVDYGYDIHLKIAEWAPFDVTVTRAVKPTAGVLGEYLEVFFCEKRA